MPRRAPALAVAFATLFAAHSAAATVAKGPWVQRVTPTSAVVRVELDAPAPARVELGVGPVGGDAGAARVVESKEPRTLHAMAVTGLTPATRYTYAVHTAGVPKYAAFTTAPPEDGGAPFRFLIYGDNRTDDAAHAAVVRAMTSAASDFVVHTGDFVDNGSVPANWQTFFDIEAPLLRERCIFSCVGNHELVGSSGIEYARYFGPSDAPPPSIDGGGPSAKAALPEHLDGSFRWGNARFFLLNGMVDYKGTVDRAWLDKAFEAADNEPGVVWRIVVVHHGPWSSGPHGNNRHMHDAGIPALFRAHKIDLVVAGHDHIYERGWADGLAYIVSGGGGAPTYRIKSALPSARKYESVRHFVEMTVSTASMQLAAIRTDGSAIERCSLLKESGWDCDKEAKTAPDASPESSASRCRCRAAGAAPARGFSWAAVLLTGIAVARRRRRRADEARGACRHAAR